MGGISVVNGPDMGKSIEITDGEVLIGRHSASCKLVLSDSSVSRVHALLAVQGDGSVTIQDQDSKNGTLVNGKLITTAVCLVDGDTLQIGKNELKFTRAESGELQLAGYQAAEPRSKAPYPYFLRSPRFLPEIPTGEIEVTAPPYGGDKPQISWLVVLLPPAAMAAMSIYMATMIKGPYVYFTMGMTLITVIVSVVTYYSQIKSFNAKETNRKTSYMNYIAGIKEDIQKKQEQQRKAFFEIHPPIDECILRASTLDRKLWERTPTDEDFLSLRLGTGLQPFRMTLKVPRQDFSLDQDPMKNEPVKLVEEFSQVKMMPICVPLVIEGAVGLVGSREQLYEIARNMIIQLATHHSYKDVKIIGVFKPGELAQWEWIRWLPHVWDDNRQVRFLAQDTDSAHKVLGVLYDQLKLRESLIKPSSRDEVPPLPRLVFLITDPGMIENEPITRYLAHGNYRLGISIIYAVDCLELLPRNCHSIIEAGSKTAQLYFRESAYEKTVVNIDPSLITQADAFCRNLAPVRLRQVGGGESLPEKVDFLGAFQASTVEELSILDRWIGSRPYRSLAIPIGKKAGGDPFLFDMHQHGHGPHGLVAGTVGSGKSEILQSIILALAVNYHPYYVAFVLIDYKGGAMARSFLGVPHLVGTITNLGGNETNRALVSIKSEIIRRQRIFDENNVSDIDTYQRLFKEGRASIPLPHLFIFADEFAELKTEQPEFIKEIVSAARVGRSLGLHLILATQKPSGVVDDQVWSNSRFKLCLKVLEPADSQEMIKRPDAASIQLPGRCYILVGHNELFEQFQSSWSGAEYDASGIVTSAKDVYIVNLDGSRQKQVQEDRTSVLSLEKETQLKAVVKHIADVAKREGIDKMPDLWLPPLSDHIYLEALHPSNRGGWHENGWIEGDIWLCPIIGMVDDPTNQLQEPVGIDLGREGHMALYGAPGTGKTTFLQTIITSLTLDHSPEQVNLYILDFGGRTMNVFNELPHLGGIVFDDQAEKLQKLFKLIKKEMENRKRRFSDIGVSSLQAYRQATDEKIPALIIVVDNFPAVSELYGDAEEIFVLLSREGGNYGIHLLITANNPNSVRYKVSQNIKCSVALQMTDKSDYIGIVGRTEGLEPAHVPGRGLMKGKPPLEYQTALPVQADAEVERAFLMKKLFKEMQQHWTGRRAKTIPILPDVLTITDLLHNDDIRELMKKDPYFIPIGLDVEELEPVGFNLVDSVSFLVSGQLNSGKSSFLTMAVELCSERLTTDNLRVYILDSADMHLIGARQDDHVAAYITESEEIRNSVLQFIDELNSRKKDVNAAKREAGRKLNEAEYIAAKYPVWLVVIDNLNELIKVVDDETKDNIERIVRFGKGLGICLLIAGQADEINKLNQIDSLTRAITDMQTGLILGGAYEQHSAFTVNMSYQERSKPLITGEGYFIQRGRYTKTKIAMTRKNTAD
ncbi:MAG TPA: type VII secretion protein EssC [Syntrophomonadaceae bacterium]|nr:type VII secretion protein EssC [Syntrophomonadaceae bacterium]